MENEWKIKLKQVEQVYYVRSTNQKKEVNLLTNKLNKIELLNDRLRTTALKRNLTQERWNTSGLRVGIWRGSFRNDSGLLYWHEHDYRRKLKGLFVAVYKRMLKSPKVHAVSLWFLSNNAKQDFIDCKTHLHE